LEPLIDFKFEVASSFLFVSTKYRQKHDLFCYHEIHEKDTNKKSFWDGSAICVT
jgi:ubiquinone biosynthesis protein Coq4